VDRRDVVVYKVSGILGAIVETRAYIPQSPGVSVATIRV
jgi:hypothetical protein